MREKYESLSLATLKELAKARGLKGISTLRKPALIERMLQEDEKEQKDTGAAIESVQKEEIREEKKEDRQESSQSPVRQYRQNGHVQENRASYDNRRRNNWQESGARTYNNQNDSRRYENGQSEFTRTHGSQNESRRYGNNQGEFTRTHGSQNEVRRYGNSQGENFRTYNSQNENRRYANGQDENVRTYNNQNEDRRAGYSQDENARNCNNQNEERRTGYSQEENSRVGSSPVENRTVYVQQDDVKVPVETAQLDSGQKANGILEVLQDGYGFIRCENFLPGENDIYVSPAQIRRFNLKTGDIVQGNIRIKTQGEKFSALLYVTSINGFHPSEGQKRYNFEDMTPIFPNQRLQMERPGGSMAMRIVDLISPIGKGQRGMIVSPPKAGKTTLLKDVAKSILRNSPDMHLIILLIDERPEEVTDIKEAIQGPNVEVIYSTFDELPEHHKRVSEMVVERARRLVEHRKDVTILLDSITRLARAYNLCVQPSGRTLSGGLDPAALHMPKRFFGAARNMREGGSLTILATALVDTGSKMDDVIYEEFKGTGNMELVLDRRLQEKRVFPAIDIQKSGTRREDLLLSREEQETVSSMRKALNSLKADEAVEQILNMFSRTRTNAEFVQTAKKQKFL
ncbi:transcription termination factor Rho [Blautia sp. XA-2221]|uniref:transcription termination factor Rho n=1 Tax=Blautia sp. XA-2221 TaxID=2903961 RepID=UPI002378AAA4|nr:transcription termination factor Rho [Blautia sp. XA-2221]